MDNTAESVTELDTTKNSLTNPNYTSIRNTQPQPSKFQLGNRREKEMDTHVVTDVEAQANDQSNSRQGAVLTNRAYEEQSFSRRRNISKRIEIAESNLNSNLNDNKNGRISLADLGILSPTEAKHMGIFQFMKFDKAHIDEEEPVDDSGKAIPLTYKEILKHILHSKALHIIIIILVILDILFVVFEVLFDLDIIHHSETNPIREMFHGFSIGILSIFMIEIALKFYVDHYHFLRHKIELLDALVVIVSWVVDVTLVFLPNTNLVAIELLVLLRLWRVFRVINGIVLAIKTEADERVHHFKTLNHELEDCLHEAEEDVERLTKDVEFLSNQLKKHGIDIKENRI